MLLETQQKQLQKGMQLSAGLASLVLFAAYSQELISVGNPAPLDLTDVRLIVGMFIGE